MAYNVARVFEQAASRDSKWTFIFNYTLKIEAIQGGSNMTGTDLCVNKPHCAAAVRP